METYYNKLLKTSRNRAANKEKSLRRKSNYHIYAVRKNHRLRSMDVNNKKFVNSRKRGGEILNSLYHTKTRFGIMLILLIKITSKTFAQQLH